MRVHKVLNNYGYLPNIPENLPDGHVDVIARAVRGDSLQIYKQNQTIENALGVFIIDTLIERLLRGQTWLIAESRYLSGREILKQVNITSIRDIERLEQSGHIKVLGVGSQSILIEAQAWFLTFTELQRMLGEHLLRYIILKQKGRHTMETKKLLKYDKMGKEYRIALGYIGRGSNVTARGMKIPSFKISPCELFHILHLHSDKIHIPKDSKQGLNQLIRIHDSNPRHVDKFLQANKTRKFVELNARGFWID